MEKSTVAHKKCHFFSFFYKIDICQNLTILSVVMTPGNFPDRRICSPEKQQQQIKDDS